MYLEVWPEDKFLAYIVDNTGFRSTIVIVDSDDRSRGAYITKVHVTEELEALLRRFDHLRPCQLDYDTLLSELRMFLAVPDAYEHLGKSDNKHVLRWCKLTESSATLLPIKVPK